MYIEFSKLNNNRKLMSYYKIQQNTYTYVPKYMIKNNKSKSLLNLSNYEAIFFVFFLYLTWCRIRQGPHYRIRLYTLKKQHKILHILYLYMKTIEIKLHAA